MRECSRICLQFALQTLFKPQEKRKNRLLRLISILGIIFEVMTRTRLASSVENLGFLSDSRTWATPVTSTHSFRSDSTTHILGRIWIWNQEAVFGQNKWKLHKLHFCNFKNPFSLLASEKSRCPDPDKYRIFYIILVFPWNSNAKQWEKSLAKAWV